MAALRLYGIQDGGPYLCSVSQTAAIPVLCIQDGGHTCALYPRRRPYLCSVSKRWRPYLCSVSKTVALPVLCIQKTAAIPVLCIQETAAILVLCIQETAAIPVLCIQNGGHIPVFCIQDGGHTCTLYPGYALLLLVVVLYMCSVSKRRQPYLCSVSRICAAAGGADGHPGRHPWAELDLAAGLCVLVNLAAVHLKTDNYCLLKKYLTVVSNFAYFILRKGNRR